MKKCVHKTQKNKKKQCWNSDQKFGFLDPSVPQPPSLYKDGVSGGSGRGGGGGGGGSIFFDFLIIHANNKHSDILLDFLNLFHVNKHVL